MVSAGGMIQKDGETPNMTMDSGVAVSGAEKIIMIGPVRVSAVETESWHMIIAHRIGGMGVSVRPAVAVILTETATTGTTWIARTATAADADNVRKQTYMLGRMGHAESAERFALIPKSQYLCRTMVEGQL